MPRHFLTPTLAAGVAAIALACAGCLMQPSYSVKVTTADGVDLEVPLSMKWEINTADDAVAVRNFRLGPRAKDQQKAMGYFFELEFLKDSRPVSVVVDDDSDAPILGIIADNAPKIVGKGMWAGTSPPYNPNDEHMAWIQTLDNSVRVFRFTVVLTDGTTHVLRMPFFVPGPTKQMFRAELGLH
jgi:hypothetical protein